MKRSGAEDLVAKPDAETEKPAVQRDTTIEATVKEAETFLEGQQVDGSTRAQTAAIEEAKADSEPPKLPQDNTMVQTAKVGALSYSQYDLLGIVKYHKFDANRMHCGILFYPLFNPTMHQI